MNAGDVALAAIATCLLPLSSETTNEADDLLKASAEDPDHPGWPKGTSDGKGGEFRPKDGADAPNPSERSKRLQKLGARRSVRSIMIRILTARRIARLALLFAGEFVPGLEAIDTVLLLKDIADITAEFLTENKAVDVALEFTKRGPYTDMQSRALAIIARAVAIIDRLSPTGRDVLIPLLRDATASVQVTAAGALWQSHRDLALPILRHWQLDTGSEVGDTAMWLSFSNGQISACGFDPRHDDPIGAADADAWGVF